MGKIKDNVLEYIRNTFSDISPLTVEAYNNKFSTYTDDEIVKYFKENDLRIYTDDDKISDKKLDVLVKRTGAVISEKIRYPQIDNAESLNEMMVLPIQMRRMQQIGATESNSSLNASTRDKVNQATRESRTSKLTDSEVAIMASLGMDNVLSELLSPRSDNQLSKQEMNLLLREKGTFSLAELPKTPESRNSLMYVDVLYKCMRVATDLVDNINDIT